MMRTFILAATAVAILFSSAALTQQPSQGTASSPDFWGTWASADVSVSITRTQAQAPITSGDAGIARRFEKMQTGLGGNSRRVAGFPTSGVGWSKVAHAILPIGASVMPRLVGSLSRWSYNKNRLGCSSEHFLHIGETDCVAGHIGFEL